MGLLPMRLMVLPKLTNNFAPKALATRFSVGQEASGGRENGNTSSGKSRGDRVGTRVTANTGFANALEVSQDRLTIRKVMEGKFDVVAGGVGRKKETLLDENVSQGNSDLGLGDGNGVFLGEVAVSDGGEEICDWVHDVN